MTQPPEELFAGKFRMLKLLGRGAMGEVWLADEVGPRNFSRQVAVKRLLVTEGISEYARESFLAEAQVIARLDHPNIVHLIELGETDDRGLYLVLDYIDGSALDRVFRRGGALSQGAVALIGREVAKALDAVHNMVDAYGNNLGVVHRDISPANILIGRDGRIRLSDFGVARIHGLGGEKTETGVFKGKLPYMPPEQALGEPFDGRADIFSLGITLHEGLLGGRLRKAETQGQLIAMIATERVATVNETVPNIMPELAAAIDQATEFKAAMRTPHAGMLAQQLHNVLFRLGPNAEEMALMEICERVAQAAGGTQTSQRQPWSMNLTGENSSFGGSFGTGPHRPQAWANPPSQSQSQHISAPPSSQTLGSNPAAATTAGGVTVVDPHSGSVTRIASITDASVSRRSTAGASNRTWFFALCGAVIVGCSVGAAYVMLSGPKKTPAANETSSTPLPSAKASEQALLAATASGTASSTTASASIAAIEPTSSSSSKASSSAKTKDSGSRNPTSQTARAPASSAPTADTEEVGTGTLMVSVNPWGNVTVDGKSYGTTPLAPIPLSAGTHTVTVTNPDLGATRSGAVKVQANKAASIRFDLKKAD